MEKIDAAFKAGCKRFDGALKGFGGCPMANDDMVGNLPTEMILSYLESAGSPKAINRMAFSNALKLAGEIFPNE
jgi:hydroxymethylglutaryl-CoA lyase